MKKLTALILTLVMLVSMTAIVPVNAASNIPVVTPDVTEAVIARGDVVTIVFSHNDDLDFSSSIFKVWFNKEVFSVAKNAHFKPYNNEYTTATYYDEDEEQNVTKTLYTLAERNLALVDGELGLASLQVKAINYSTNMTEEIRTYYPNFTGSEYITLKLTVAEDAPAGTYDIPYTAFFVNKESVDLPDPNGVNGTIKLTIPGDEPELDVDANNIKTNEFQFRTSGDFGFRFVSTIKNYAGADYGTLVIPSDLLVGELTTETALVANVPALNFMEEKADMVKFNATLVDVERNHNAIYREYAVRAYAIVDGEIKYGETVKCTINAQLESAIAKGDAAAEYLQGILDAAK